MRSEHRLEVVRYIRDYDEADERGDNFEHVGYRRARLRTKEKAASYYDRHNPHMRGLDAHGNWRSDWDANSHRMDIVRENHHVNDNIAPFAPRDEPVVNRGAKGSVSVTYPCLYTTVLRGFIYTSSNQTCTLPLDNTFWTSFEHLSSARTFHSTFQTRVS